MDTLLRTAPFAGGNTFLANTIFGLDGKGIYSKEMLFLADFYVIGKGLGFWERKGQAWMQK